MSRYGDRPIPAHVQELLNHVTHNDAIIIESEAFLRASGCVEVKRRTDVATMRVVTHWRSMNAESHENVKYAIKDYFEKAYNVIEMEFRQSADEHKRSTEDCVYFHGIGIVRDSCNQSSQTTD